MPKKYHLGLTIFIFGFIFPFSKLIKNLAVDDTAETML
jgi:hypothetical protein